MRTKDEFNAMKEEAETVSKKLRELSAEELAQVTGGEHCVNKPRDSFVLPESVGFALPETLTK